MKSRGFVPQARDLWRKGDKARRQEKRMTGIHRRPAPPFLFIYPIPRRSSFAFSFCLPGPVVFVVNESRLAVAFDSAGPLVDDPRSL